jgi:hypothetical protein
MGHRAKQLRMIEKVFQICLEKVLRIYMAISRNHLRKSLVDDTEVKKVEALDHNVHP